MKLVDYELILKGLREKYPDHTIDIKDAPRAQWWDEPKKTLWIDGKKTETIWPECLGADIDYSSGGTIDPHNEISFIINEEIKKYLDIL